MIAGPAFVTPHAVRRFMQRVRPGLTYEQALAEIIRGLRDGVRTVKPPRPLSDGTAVVYLRCVGPNSRFLATVLFGDRTHGNAPQVVTVRSWMRGTSAGRGRPRRQDRLR